MRVLGMEKKVDSISPNASLMWRTSNTHLLATISSLLCGAHHFDLLVLSGNHREGLSLFRAWNLGCDWGPLRPEILPLPWLS